ncbi:3' terminal RNA ribose 2'-O-methyltransferase Hen1 [Corynebacterium amycolatum]|uniref:3' terminal RNA ribose 2'-O-methyltransferase Hen1 n=1 Tax=Corynebacterium amycolatum TaxID=43765 RepID=UPI0012B93BCE|nr:3' terminal RNA ribose 2'-O-methyltransferase Hen1 [Corynebacterium amycolatum]KAA9268247.1 3' terminal RNA ribose 2'-O-methyltransferase Hen1 [Corynebacterium amycolatum]MBU5623424.1 3' terminal RNA ribose 2'-O-methyltransferase Hen1 [Corynebacterium amycolatum]
MYLAITKHSRLGESSPGESARDLGFILRKHPDRVHEAELKFGVARVFFPTATDAECTAALWVDIDRDELLKLKQYRADTFNLTGYINDRQWAASSLLTVALKSVFSTAMVMEKTSPYDETPSDLTATVAAVPGTEEEIRALFEPLGWKVTCDFFNNIAGQKFSPTVTLTGRATVRDLLNHLYILLPVLDGGKHYWVDDREIDKLAARAQDWLPEHPQREKILKRYLADQKGLVNEAVVKLAGEAGAIELASGDQTAKPLNRQRQDRVLREVFSLRPRSVVDIGCGSGVLLGPMLENPRIAQIVGTDVSVGELRKAHKALNLDRMPERQAARVELFQSSVTYADERIANMDVAILMEVIEHVDADRLPALENNVFGLARPQYVIVTTPNSDYNACYPNLAPGQFRHLDHRFEFSRVEFRQWANGVADKFGYLVDFDGIGDVHETYGQPTQMAVFSFDFTAAEES